MPLSFLRGLLGARNAPGVLFDVTLPVYEPRSPEEPAAAATFPPAPSAHVQSAPPEMRREVPESLDFGMVDLTGSAAAPPAGAASAGQDYGSIEIDAGALLDLPDGLEFDLGDRVA